MKVFFDLFFILRRIKERWVLFKVSAYHIINVIKFYFSLMMYLEPFHPNSNLDSWPIWMTFWHLLKRNKSSSLLENFSTLVQSARVFKTVRFQNFANSKNVFLLLISRFFWETIWNVLLHNWGARFPILSWASPNFPPLVCGCCQLHWRRWWPLAFLPDVIRTCHLLKINLKLI